MSAPSLTVAILAGGRATRLDGRDKGLERVGGETLIARAIAFWSSRTGTPGVALLIVANRHIDEYARHAPTISDALPGFRGPLAGVAAALAQARTHRVLTVPVDCPDPPPDLAERLVAALDARAARAAVVHDGERRQPLFAAYERGLAADAASAAGEGLGPQAWQARIGAIDVDFSDRRRQFHNLNTPADFAAFDNELRSRLD